MGPLGLGERGKGPINSFEYLMPPDLGRQPIVVCGDWPTRTYLVCKSRQEKKSYIFHVTLG